MRSSPQTIGRNEKTRQGPLKAPSFSLPRSGYRLSTIAPPQGKLQSSSFVSREIAPNTTSIRVSCCWDPVGSDHCRVVRGNLGHGKSKSRSLLELRNSVEVADSAEEAGLCKESVISQIDRCASHPRFEAIVLGTNAGRTERIGDPPIAEPLSSRITRDQSNRRVKIDGRRPAMSFLNVNSVQNAGPKRLRSSGVIAPENLSHHRESQPGPTIQQNSIRDGHSPRPPTMESSSDETVQNTRSDPRNSRRAFSRQIAGSAGRTSNTPVPRQGPRSQQPRRICQIRPHPLCRPN